MWLAGNTCALTAGAMALVYIADTITELKLGNGTSVSSTVSSLWIKSIRHASHASHTVQVVIFANIASALPVSVGQLVSQNAGADLGVDLHGC